MLTCGSGGACQVDELNMYRHLRPTQNTLSSSSPYWLEDITPTQSSLHCTALWAQVQDPEVQKGSLWHKPDTRSHSSPQQVDLLRELWVLFLCCFCLSLLCAAVLNCMYCFCPVLYWTVTVCYCCDDVCTVYCCFSCDVVLWKGISPWGQ